MTLEYLVSNPLRKHKFHQDYIIQLYLYICEATSPRLCISTAGDPAIISSRQDNIEYLFLINVSDSEYVCVCVCNMGKILLRLLWRQSYPFTQGISTHQANSLPRGEDVSLHHGRPFRATPETTSVHKGTRVSKGLRGEASERGQWQGFARIAGQNTY